MSEAPPAAPAPPPYALRRGLIAAGMSVLVGATQGLGINLVSANLAAIQGALGATPIEGAWLVTAYMVTNISSSLLLIKFRFEFGLRLFAEIGLILFLVTTAAHLLVRDLPSAIALRAAQGLAAAPLTSLALLYMIGAFPAEQRSRGVALGMAASQLGLPLARVISPDLLQIGQWHGLYLLELGLAVVCLAGVAAFPLPQTPRVKMFAPLDLASFALFAPGLGLLVVVLSLGRFVWWFEAPWLGWCLIGAILFLAAANLLELHRRNPLVDVRWLSSGDMLRFLIVILIFRIALSEQTTGAVGFMTTLGLANEQMAVMFWIVLVCTVAGFLITAFTLNTERPLTPLMIALSLIIVAAWSDSHITTQSRPAQFYLSQGMMAFAGALFLPPAMLFGVSRAMARSQQHLVSYAMVFGAGQNIGGQLGAALLSTFVIVREKFHSAQLTQGLTLADPQVAARVRQLAGAYAHVIPDARLRNAQALASLSRQATQQAYALAYADAFQVVAVLAAAALVWLLALRLRTRLAARTQELQPA